MRAAARAGPPAATATAPSSSTSPHRRRQKQRANLATAATADVDAATASLALAISALAPIFIVPLAKAFLRPRRCSSCLGSTTQTCRACLGRGRLGFVLPGAAPPSSAAAAPLSPSSLPPSLPRCEACGGRGRVGCAACGSTGLANAWLWKPTDDPDAWGARGE